MPPNCSIRKKGCRESKKVEKHCARQPDNLYAFGLSSSPRKLACVASGYCTACDTDSHDRKVCQSPRSGVNFINVFTCNFYACRSQKRKKLLELTVVFVLLGSLRVKAARKLLVKLTPGDP